MEVTATIAFRLRSNFAKARHSRRMEDMVLDKDLASNPKGRSEQKENTDMVQIAALV